MSEYNFMLCFDQILTPVRSRGQDLNLRRSGFCAPSRLARFAKASLYSISPSMRVGSSTRLSLRDTFYLTAGSTGPNKKLSLWANKYLPLKFAGLPNIRVVQSQEGGILSHPILDEPSFALFQTCRGPWTLV